ncbi:neuraminidase-like domain-containing protein [Dactylosporangium sp. NPDC005572]|uniref:Tc toxin subunit A-related protein n=1 Tax=Dactylosporangium sp. NPDC005572 TaxID=3156889 RepID=UPI0033AF2A2D
MTLELDRTGPAAAAPADGTRTVRGAVTFAGGRGIAGRTVVAWHKRLRGESELGRTVTGADGGYEITYPPGGTPVDLLVRVYAQDGTTAAAESPVVFSAGEVESVPLTVDGGPLATWSQYEQLMQELQPHLGGVQLADLAQRAGQRDLSLLAGKVARPAEQLAALVVAHKLARRTGLQPEVHYGYVRQQLPTNLSALLATEPAVRIRALEEAVRQRIVPGVLHDRIEQTETAFRAAAAKYGAGPAPIAKLLGGVLDQPADRETFLARYAAHVDDAARDRAETDPARFWTQLAGDPRLGPKVPELQFTMQVAALTGGHAPLVNRLRAMRSGGEAPTFRHLARLGVADWKTVITSQPVPAADQVPAEITGADHATRVARYAETLERIVTDAMPTQVLAHRAQADQTRSAGLRAFWTNVTARGVVFELGAVKVETFLAAHPELLQGVTDTGAVTRELRATQRVFNLTRRHTETAALLDAGLTSATDIAKLNHDDFVERYGQVFPDAERAGQVHAQAATVAAAAMATVAAYSPQYNTVDVAGVLTPNAVDVPTLTSLFGSLDACACEHCKSVAGPAAYYAEILEFLSQRGAEPPFGNALKVLLARRPDLGDIELTCENTNTELPYIDLVNEVLEQAVAPFAPFTVPAALAADLDLRKVPDPIRAPFAQAGYPLSAGQVVYVVLKGQRWHLSDGSVRFDLVRGSATSPTITVTAMTYQTGADAGRLAASPEHVSTRAYDVLRSAVFPLDLPLDLWRAETAAMLGHFGADRASLLTELSPSSPWTAFNRPEVVGERLGLAPAERVLLTGGTPVRAATTGPLSALSDLRTVDGVALTAGQLVLVKDQADQSQHGVYTVGAGAWSRADAPGLVAVAEGTVNQATTWRLVPTATGHRGERVMPWHFYGLAQTGNPVEVFNGSSVPAVQQLDWLSALTWVTKVIDRLAVSYEELVELLTTRYVNPDAAVRIVSAQSTDPTTGELWKLKLTGVTEPFLARLHLFVRLWRRLGWTTTELDATLAVFQGAPAQPFTPTVLRGCLAVQLLATRFGLTREQVLTFWSPLPVTGPDPLYQRLFTNPAVVDPVNPAFVPVNGAVSVAAEPQANRATLAAALGVNDGELATLLAALAPTGPLDLARLSGLYRHVLLARGLGLPVADLLTFKAMTGLTDVFLPQNPHNVLFLAELLDRVAAAGTSVAELDHLLHHRGSAATTPADSAITAVLDDVRTAVRALHEQDTAVVDRDGTALRSRLAALGWPDELIDDLLVALSPDAVYAAPLASLPPGFQVPADLRGRVDWAHGVLRVTGPLTVAERDLLSAAAPAASAFLAAVKQIFTAARSAVTRLALRWPTFHAPLKGLPAGVVFPAEIKARVFYDAPARRLCFRGAMTAADRRLLHSLSTEGLYRAAVEELYAAVAQYQPEPDNVLVSTVDAARLFDEPVTILQRYAIVLARVLTFVRVEQGTEIVVQHLAEALAVPTHTVRALLTGTLHAGTAPGQFAIADLLEPAYLDSEPEITITAAGFPHQFATVRRLAKTHRLTGLLRLQPGQLHWLGMPGVPVRPAPWLSVTPVSTGWLHPDELAVTEPVDPSPARFAAWLRLVDLAAARDRVPGGADTVERMFADAGAAGATTATVLGGLATRTGWAPADLTALAAKAVLDLTAVDRFADETALARLVPAIGRITRLGASVAQTVAFTAPSLTAADARAAVQLVRARSTVDEWPRVARPLRDTLRELQRKALVSYLVTNPDPARGQHWRDANGLYGHFLIDTEMSACATTSRLKQAISSAQQFVQRCLLGLETGPKMTSSGWRDWPWMKQYRVWEAARKVFLFPENWIAPELRADRSPLFRAAEAELGQDDVTSEAAERVVAGYIHKLSMIARLEVAGIYRVGSSDIHVFGRVPGTPTPLFYHRRFLAGRWTAWEPVDLDITERHILPVVWRDRLFLFWPVYTETPVPVYGGAGPVADPSPNELDMQLAWSEYVDGKWQPRRITTQRVRSDLGAVGPRGDHLFWTEKGSTDLQIWFDSKIAGTQRDGWRFSGPEGFVQPIEHEPIRVYPPANTHEDGTDFVQLAEPNGWDNLYLPKDDAAYPDATYTLAFKETPGRYTLSYPHQYHGLRPDRPFFFSDDERTFYVTSRTVTVNFAPAADPARVDPAAIDRARRHYYRGLDDDVDGATVPDPAGHTVDDGRLDAPQQLVVAATQQRRYLFQPHFHGRIANLVQGMSSGGPTNALSRTIQLGETDTFDTRYDPTTVVDAPYPVEDIDFTYGGGYALYNWELFFHLPLLIADRLSANQRFEEAQRWLHLVFDPTDSSTLKAPQKYWQTKPLHKLSNTTILNDRIDKILKMLAGGNPPDDLLDEVDQWRDSPFDPHAIARLRPTAYAKNVVMRYLDNLIAWGDQLFRRDTLESVNEATQLYVLAAQILGPRPALIPPRAVPQVQTYSTLELDLGTLSNELVDIEYLFGSVRPDTVVVNPNTPPVPLPKTLYFGVPANDKLLGYWDKVADRLFKIRHCMNVDGIERRLPLFEPPIDPALLVQASAAGADIAGAIADAAAPQPVYRFRALAAKAAELTQHVQQLGASLTQVLEKRDAEDLAALRAGQETTLLRTMEQIRVQQVEAATRQLETLRAARDQAMVRYVHYQRLQGVTQLHRPGEGEEIQEVAAPTKAAVVNGEGTKMIASEQQQLDELATAHRFQDSAHGWEAAAILSYYIPDLSIATLPWGVGGSVKLGISGSALGPALQAMASRERAGASKHADGSARAAIVAGLVHRETEMVLQQNLAGKELMQIDKQLAEAAVRVRIATDELAAHRSQIEQARGTEEFLHSKYTNAELYNWMIGRTAQAYFAGYQLAFDVAKRAERAYRFELGVDGSSFVQYSYWDSLRKGLLAGEALHRDLQRMQVSYLDLNRREHEMTKHISLANLHPEGLLALRRQGSCYLELPEALFDLDQPGHHMRRIKSVSVTIPCTTGPYTNVTARLTLLANRTRVSAAVSPGYAWTGPEDQRFRSDSGGVQSIVTSTGHEDAGMFQTNFDDERYLPFEGAGAIGAWRIELPDTFRQFDYESISDVILHVRYTARDGGGQLRSAAKADLAAAITSMPVGEGAAGLYRMVSGRTDLGDGWPRFLHPDGAAPHILTVPLGRDRFPAHVRDRALKVNAAAVFVRLAAGLTYDPADPIELRLTGPAGPPAELSLAVSPAELGGLPAAGTAFAQGVPVSAESPWRLEVRSIPAALAETVTVGGTTVTRFKEGVLADVGVVFGYTF